MEKLFLVVVLISLYINLITIFLSAFDIIKNPVLALGHLAANLFVTFAILTFAVGSIIVETFT